MFKQLTNRTLIEAYENAKFLRLEQEFIEMLEQELVNRGIYIKDRDLSMTLEHQNS